MPIVYAGRGLAPHAGWRARVVAHGVPQVEAPVAASASANANDDPAAAPNSRHWAWTDLMRRALAIPKAFEKAYDDIDSVVYAHIQKHRPLQEQPTDILEPPGPNSG
jgi:hypothetical protein